MGLFEPRVVETVEATRAFNTSLVNYVAIFFVIVDYFVYCLGPLYVNTTMDDIFMDKNYVVKLSIYLSNSKFRHSNK